MAVIVGRRYSIAESSPSDIRLPPGAVRGVDTRTGADVWITASESRNATIRDADLVQARERLTALRHPAIERIIDVLSSDDHLYVVTAPVEGESAAELSATARFTLQQSHALVLEVAEALAYAHDRQVIHGDIRPQTVFRGSDGHARITGFVLAANLPGRWQWPAVIPGTLLYEAPEMQSAHPESLTPLVDVYLTGALLYQLATGLVPHQLPGVDYILAATLRGFLRDCVPPSDLNPDIPHEWDAVILRAIATRPQDRYQSMGELAAALLALLPPANDSEPEEDVLPVAEILSTDHMDVEVEAATTRGSAAPLPDDPAAEAMPAAGQSEPAATADALAPVAIGEQGSASEVPSTVPQTRAPVPPTESSQNGESPAGADALTAPSMGEPQDAGKQANIAGEEPLTAGGADSLKEVEPAVEQIEADVTGATESAAQVDAPAALANGKQAHALPPGGGDRAVVNAAASAEPESFAESQKDPGLREEPALSPAAESVVAGSASAQDEQGRQHLPDLEAVASAGRQAQQAAPPQREVPSPSVPTAGRREMRGQPEGARQERGATMAGDAGTADVEAFAWQLAGLVGEMASARRQLDEEIAVLRDRIDELEGGIQSDTTYVRTVHQTVAPCSSQEEIAALRSLMERATHSTELGIVMEISNRAGALARVLNDYAELHEVMSRA